MKFKTPQEIWNGKPAYCDQLKVLRRTTYAHHKQDKLDPRAKKCIFLGYIDVVFNEEEMPLKKHESPSTQKEAPIEVESIATQSKKPDSEDFLNEDQGGDSDSKQENSYQLVRDISRRKVRAPLRFGYADITAYALFVTSEKDQIEPENYKEAISCKHRKQWVEATEKEIKSLDKNKTWIMVGKHKNQKLVGCRWIYKKKYGILGVEQARFKAWLVAKGFTQNDGIDYNEIFSHVVKQTSIIMVMSLVVEFDWELEQMDVTTFSFMESLRRLFT